MSDSRFRRAGTLVAFVASRWTRFLHRFRSLSLRRIALASLALSAVLISANFPLRWEGGRTELDKDIPLRPLSPVEVAALLTGTPDGRPLAGLVRFDGSDVVVRTAVYLVPAGPGADPSGRVHYRGVVFDFQSSSWAGFHNVHLVERAALERVLGRPLTTRDLTPGYLADSKASFSSNRVALYFAEEVGILTMLLAGVGAGLRRIRNPLLIPVLISVAGVAGILIVPVYSPAFFDADWFYQRIALEELIGGRGLLGRSFHLVMTIAFPLTLICLPLLLLGLFARGVHRLSGAPVATIRAFVAAALAAVLLGQLAVEHLRYRRARTRAQQAFSELREALDGKALASLKSDPALQVHEVELLARGTLSPPSKRIVVTILSAAARAEEGRVFIPLGTPSVGTPSGSGLRFSQHEEAR